MSQEQKKTRYVRHLGDDKIQKHRPDHLSAEWEILPAGIYKSANVGGLGPTIPAYWITKAVEDLISFKEGVVSDILNRTAAFFSADVVRDYARLKVAHKMGILMHGKPGVGKSSCAYLIMQLLVEKYQAICVDCTGNSMGWIRYIAEDIRKYQPQPIVIFIDEFEYTTKKYEADLLTFLDGSDSVPGVIVLGCTNFLEKIPERIKNRKSRIKHLIPINSFPYAVYKQYIAGKVEDIDEKILGEISYHCVEAGLTLDQTKHILIDHFIEKIPLADVLRESTTENIPNVVVLKSKSSEDEDEDDDD